MRAPMSAIVMPRCAILPTDPCPSTRGGGARASRQGAGAQLIKLLCRTCITHTESHIMNLSWVQGCEAKTAVRQVGPAHSTVPVAARLRRCGLAHGRIHRDGADRVWPRVRITTCLLQMGRCGRQRMGTAGWCSGRADHDRGGAALPARDLVTSHRDALQLQGETSSWLSVQINCDHGDTLRPDARRTCCRLSLEAPSYTSMCGRAATTAGLTSVRLPAQGFRCSPARASRGCRDLCAPLAVGYGFCHVPLVEGCHSLDIPTWLPEVSHRMGDAACMARFS